MRREGAGSDQGWGAAAQVFGFLAPEQASASSAILGLIKVAAQNALKYSIRRKRRAMAVAMTYLLQTGNRFQKEMFLQ